MTTEPVLTNLVSFNGANGEFPNPGLIADAQGDLFGTAEGGGASKDGAVFEVVNTGTLAAPAYASAPTTFATFNGANGVEPGSLIADAQGDLFGITVVGGANNDGTVFEIVNSGTAAAPAYASAPMTLFNFDGSYGGLGGGLIADAEGDLFGTTVLGGADGDGSVFEIVNTGTVAAPAYASAPTTLVSFSTNGAAGPYPGGLIANAHGDLFGVTAFGGASEDGTVFEIANSGTATAPVYASVPTTLVSFDGAHGKYPNSGLIADGHGDLFGSTDSGGATVFEIANTGTTAAPVYASAPTTLASFTNSAYPVGDLIADAKGDLFGCASGAYSDGTVFEVVNTGTAAAPVYAGAPTTVVSLDANPLGGLIADDQGDLFGTTGGGASTDGTVFELTNSGFQVVAIASAGGVTNQTDQTIGGVSLAADIDSGSTVSIYDGSTLLGTTTVAADGTWSVSVTLASTQGDHLLTAQTTNILGNVVSSAAVAYTYDTIAPTLAITSSGGLAAQASRTVSGTIVAAEAGLTVSIYSGSTLIGTTTAAADGTWTASATLLAKEGAQSITATATDGESLVGTSAAVSYALENQYIWKSVVTGSWNVASNWQDTTTGQSSATVAPGADDAVTINAPSAGATHVIEGTGNSASLTIGGATVLRGQFTTGTLDLSNNSNSAVTLNAGNSLTVNGDAALGQGASLTDNGGSLSIGANLTASQASLSVSGVAVTIGGDADIGALTDTGGAISVTRDLSGGVDMSDANLNVGDDLTISGSVTLLADQSLTVGGDADVSGLTLSGGAISVGGGLTAGGGADIGGSTMTVGSDLTINGATELVDATASITGNANVESTLSVDGSAIMISGALATSSNASFTVTNGGSVQVQQGTLTSSNINLSIDATSSFEFGATGSAAVGAVTIDQGMTIAVASGAWTAPSIVDNGAVTVSTALTLSGALTGDGEIDLADGAGLTLQSIAADSANTLAFEGDGVLTLSSTALNSAGAFAISNFDASDAIEFEGVATDATYADGVLTLDDNGTTVAEVNLNGDYSDDSFDAISVGAGVTQISLGPAWTADVSGSFTDASDWSTDSVPDANDSVAISASSPVAAELRFGSAAAAARDYTVSWTRAGTIHSLQETSARATLAVADPGHVNRIAGNAIFKGALQVDAAAGKGGSTLKIGGALTNKGTITLGNSTLRKTTTLSAGKISNAGMIRLIDSSTEGVGVALTAGSLDSWGEIDVAAHHSTMDFGFDVRNSGKIVVTSGALNLSGPANALIGSIGGAGALALTEGSTTLETGASIATARWSIRGAATRVTLDRNLTYRGTFTLAGGAVFDTAGGALDLTGASAALSGVLEGSHVLSTHGKTIASALTIGGTEIWRNFGTVTQGAKWLTLGSDKVRDAADLQNEAGATYDLTADGGIAHGASTESRIVNAGLFEKTGGLGVSWIAPAVANTGTLKVSSGTLDVKGYVWGKGMDLLSDASKLEFGSGVGSDQTIDFTSLGGDLVLADPHAFAGEIKGFYHGDIIEIMGTLSDFHAMHEAGGVSLSFTDAGRHDSLTLIGNYTASRFAESGEIIKYT